jgi:hypothetical protein
VRVSPVRTTAPPRDPGQKAVSGGFSYAAGFVIGSDTLPTAGNAGWQVYLINLDEGAGVSGTVYAVYLG